MAEKKSWNRSLDLIKTVAIITVLMTHISASFVIKYPSSSPEFIWGNIVDSLSRIGVPLFLMVSGSLFLDEDKSFNVKAFFRKHLLVMAVLLVFWSLIYGFFYHALGGVGVWDYILNFSGTLYPHIWYMYMIIGLYLIVPVLRLFVKRENKRYILYFILLSVVFNYIPSFLSLFKNIMGFSISTYTPRLFLNFVSGYTTYFLLGWYLTNVEIKEKTKKALVAAGTLSLIFMIALTQVFESSIPESYNYTYDNLSLLPLLYSTGAFVLLYRKENSGKEGRFCRTVSKFTFGIYMLHIMILEVFMAYLLPYSSSSFFTPILYMALVFVVLAPLSLLSALLIGKVPYLKKLLYL